MADAKPPTKAEAHYRKGTGGRNCDNCEYMEKSGMCSKLKVMVKPDDVCDYWRKGK